MKSKTPRLPLIAAALLMAITGCRTGGEPTVAQAPPPAPAPVDRSPATGVVADPEPVARNVPYSGAVGRADPIDVPLPPGQTPLAPWTQAALDVWWERPSPTGPEPIPVERPRAVYARGGDVIDQALPGPAVYIDHLPQFMQVPMPPMTPFSNHIVLLEEGEFEMVVFDYTKNDTKLSRDSLEVRAEFVDSAGHRWRVESVAPAKMAPNPVLDPWAGGVVVDSLWHGETGRATPLFPLINHKVGLWAWADIYKDDKRVASSALIHVMLTNNTRDPTNWHYQCYDCTGNPVQQIHLMIPPSNYLPAPGGYLHVMWENSTFIEGTPEEVMAQAPDLARQVPTIELNAVPYLAWDKTEIPVEVGQTYRLIVHNNDPSSFHQFSLHSHPEGDGHHSDDLRHEHGGTAGRTGGLWRPGGQSDGHTHRHGDPPAPANVFFPLPQGSTWATYVTFDEAGEYKFMCPVSNHYRRGMEGHFIATASGGGAR